MFYDEVEVRTIMLAVGNCECIGLSSKEILLRSIVWLREYYEKTLKKEILKKAVWHIYAYLKLGYPYDEGEAEFQTILQYLGVDRETVFPVREWIYKKVKLTNPNICHLLGKWNPKLHSMNKPDAVADIMKKVTEKRVGEYTYFSGKVIAQEKEKTLWQNTYKLIVRRDEAVFYNVNQNKYYMLV